MKAIELDDAQLKRIAKAMAEKQSSRQIAARFGLKQTFAAKLMRKLKEAAKP
jgi:ribosomal protein S25